MVRVSRVLPIALLVIAVAVVAVIAWPGGGSSYTVRAIFPDAGQMISGAEVQVGGRAVGKVTELKLTPDFRAEAVMRLDAREVRPLHAGTTAAIRAVSLSGVTNRFIDLTPGPDSAPAIPDGGALPDTATRGIVDLDTLLDSLDPATRRRLQALVAHSAQGIDGVAKDSNRALETLNPAVAQFGALGEEAAHDTAAVQRLVRTGARTASTLAQRRGAVESGISDTAAALESVAGQRRALGDSLARLPGVLAQAQGTLGRTRVALVKLRPALRELRPVAAPLAALLRRLAPTARQALPAVRTLDALLPALRRGLDGLPALAKGGVPALTSTTGALSASQDIFTGLRQFAPDLVVGGILGIGGMTTAGYDANGHYARLMPLVGLAGTSGLPSIFPQLTGKLDSTRPGLTDRCPGAAAPPAADASNPWVPAPGACDPEQDPK